MDISRFVTQGLMSARALHELMQIRSNAEHIVLLDATFVLPDSAPDPRIHFSNEHIPGARYFDIEQICDRTSPLPHMLPPKADFEHAMDELGISNSDLVVIYGQNSTVMGPARAWWMLRYFGHDPVCVLDGGLPAWKAGGYETVSGAAVGAYGAKAPYRATERPALLARKQDILKATRTESAMILDARPPARFAGTTPEPRAGLRSGHIDGSHNIPATDVIVPSSGLMKPQEELARLFSHLVPSKEKTPIITSCGSGVTACALALALFTIGHKNVSVYDGSWAEWGQISTD